MMKRLQNIFLHRAHLLVVSFLLMTGNSFGQESQDKIPDGTQGEELERVETDTLPGKWKDKRWRLFPGKFTTFKFGGGFDRESFLFDF